jgi:D-ribose pyranose/furanose isomerase RbsD
MADEHDWKSDLREAVSQFGHRNWILVADSAFPHLVAHGVRQVLTHRDAVSVLEWTLRAVHTAPHVEAAVHVDAELDHLTDSAAPGIDAFRVRLAALAPQAKRAPHEDLIRRVSEAGAAYSVLVLKTESTLPYTTVFLELDCGYWDADRESALRAALEAL